MPKFLDRVYRPLNRPSGEGRNRVGEVRIATGWLGSDVEIRFEGEIRGRVEIREPGQEWAVIEKVEGSVCQTNGRYSPHRASRSLADFQALDL